MPELPEVEALATFLRERAVGRTVVRADVAAINAIKTYDPPLSALGGLTVTEVRKNRSGIPLLGGLPIVGKLFSFTKEQETRRDLIILVTPRITDDGVSQE